MLKSRKPKKRGVNFTPPGKLNFRDFSSLFNDGNDGFFGKLASAFFFPYSTCFCAIEIDKKRNPDWIVRVFQKSNSAEIDFQNREPASRSLYPHGLFHREKPPADTTSNRRNKSHQSPQKQSPCLITVSAAKSTAPSISPQRNESHHFKAVEDWMPPLERKASDMPNHGTHSNGLYFQLK